MTNPRADDYPGVVSVEASEARRIDAITPGGHTAVAGAWRQAVAKSKRESQARRARVLAHEDLAQRLKDPPLRLTEPSRWSGWIPPKTLAEDACANCETGHPRPSCRGWPHRSRVNDSATRHQLVEIAAEAMAREGTS